MDDNPWAAANGWADFTHDDLVALRAELEYARGRSDGYQVRLWDALAENDRLRAVVDAALEWRKVRQTTVAIRPHREDRDRLLAAENLLIDCLRSLDVSGNMGGRALGGRSQCPVCGRAWTLTPLDDCLVPACGCYGHDVSADNPSRPCHSCGLAHALKCSLIPDPRHQDEET